MSEKKKVDKTFGDKIYNLRTSENYSQEYVGRLAGVSRQTVSKWEANGSQPKYENLQKLCKALDVGMSYFDSKSTTDKPEETAAKETAPESEVVCDEATGGEETQEVKVNEVNDVVVQEAPTSVQEAPTRKESKLSGRAKIIITSVILAIVLLLGIAMIVINKFSVPTNDRDFDRVEQVIVWNMGIDTIGWIIFSISIAVAFIVGMVLVGKRLKAKNDNKEEVAESHLN